MLTGHGRTVWRNTEWRVFLGVLGLATLLIAGNSLESGIDRSMPQALRDAAFQIVSISTTTGFATVDFATWPPFSQTLLLLLMFIGGCLGSTSGALRLERLILLGKLSVQRLRRMVRPRQVELLLIDETPVERETVHYITTYFGLYLGIAACILRSAPAIEGYAPTCKANRIRHSGIGAGFLTVSQTQDRRPS